jgi:mevalonate kinase
MPAFTATAPGKIILFGEHAVVYHRPAIAVPVTQVKARVVVSADIKAPQARVHILAPDIRLEADLNELSVDDPIARAIYSLIHELGIDRLPACQIHISSTIPLAAGMGSGAAVSVALIRAFAGFLGFKLAPERVSDLAFQVEKLHHGTPSGIDNTVVTYAAPVFYQREHPIQMLKVGSEMTLVVADTGVISPTVKAVGDLRAAWQASPDRYERIFDQIGEITLSARTVIEQGEPSQIGPLMDQNHEYLVQVGVSSPELENLVIAAREAGAWGAKLSGAGRGGNIVAVVAPESAEYVARVLQEHGAVRTLITKVETSK